MKRKMPPLTEKQLTLLKWLENGQPCSMRAYAFHIGVNPNKINERMKSLRTRGLVKKCSPHRHVLTDEGYAVLRGAAE